MTTTLATFDGQNATGDASRISVFQNSGERIQWRISNPATGQTRYASSMMGAPNYGYYDTTGRAMASAKRILSIGIND